MRAPLVIARRELRSYFDYPTAYILVVAFLGLGLFLAFRTILGQRVGTLRPFFDLLPWLGAIFVPAMTMRSLAEERRSKTVEWLMSQPITELHVVGGKFLGNWMFVLIAIGGSIPAALWILLASDADAGMMLAQYVGAALLAGQYVAIGIWASSVTRNQITSFILASTACLALVLIGLPVVLIGLPPVLSGAIAKLSVLPHFENVARGVVDVRDVLYFATIAGLFLVLAAASLLSSRLSRTRGTYRRLRLGTAAVAASALVLNLLGGYIGGRLDLTQGRLFTLSPGTRDLLRGLDDKVQIKLFVSGQLPPEVQLVLRDVRDLLNDMKNASRGNLDVIERNPERDTDAQSEAQSYGIIPTNFNVLRDDEFQVKRGWFGIAVQYLEERRVIPLVDRTDDLELTLASDIFELTASEKPRLVFLTGNGMGTAAEFPVIEQVLGSRYEISSRPLHDSLGAPIPVDSIRVAILAAPSVAIDSVDVDRLDQYLNNGGSLFIMLENMRVSPQFPQPIPAFPGLDRLLRRHGVELQEGVVFDIRSHANVQVGAQGMQEIVRGYPLWPIVFAAGDHATIRNLENLSLGWPAPLRITDRSTVVPLWVTTSESGAHPVDMPLDPNLFVLLPGDSLSQQTVSVAVDPGMAAGGDGEAAPARRGGRMVITGDMDFLDEQFFSYNEQNVIFAANALDWLAQEETLIRIRSKHRMPPAMVFESTVGSSAFKYGNLIGVPLLFALFGLVRISGRVRRARRDWGEEEPTAPAEADAAAGGKLDE